MLKSKKGFIWTLPWIVAGIVATASFLGLQTMKAVATSTTTSGTFGSIPPMYLIIGVVFVFLILMRR